MKKVKNKMRDGDIAIFSFIIDGDVYSVRCECYRSYYFEELMTGITWYKNNAEILHAGHGEQIDTLEKARTSIENVIKLRDDLISTLRKDNSNGKQI